MKYIFFFSFFSFFLYAQEQPKRILYQYKKFEKFDLGKLNIESGADSSLGIDFGSRKNDNYKNMLPEKADTKNELKNAFLSLP